jgi:hypothetical protein
MLAERVNDIATSSQQLELRTAQSADFDALAAHH